MNSTPLEQQLFAMLLEKYKAKGLNPQSILSNTLFQQLPLAAKISVLENNLGGMTGAVNKPKFLANLKDSGLGLSAGLAGAGAALATLLELKKGVPEFGGSFTLMSGLAGAALGAIPSIIAAKKNYNRDVGTYNDLRENKYLSAIVGRSGRGQDKGSSISVLNTLSQEISKGLGIASITRLPTE